MTAARCNLIVPGFGKCGTSSFHEYLAIHPEICMSAVKEPQFFSFPEQLAKGIAAHNALFDHCSSGPSRVFGESSTTYSIWEPALEQIQKHLPDVKLIVLLREPVDRVISHYRWMYAGGLETSNLLKALRIERHSSYDPHVHRKGCYPCYLRASRYSHFCPIMFQLFGRERVLLVRTEELATDRANVLNAVFRFLGLREFDVQTEIRVNTTDAIIVQRTLGLDALARAMPSGVRRALGPRHPLGRTLRRVLGRKKIAVPTTTDQDYQVLRELLEDDIAFYNSVPLVNETNALKS